MAGKWNERWIKNESGCPLPLFAGCSLVESYFRKRKLESPYVVSYGWLQGKPQGEATAAAVAGFIDDIAAVRTRNLAGQAQTKAGALDAAAQRVVGAIKLLENF